MSDTTLAERRPRRRRRVATVAALSAGAVALLALAGAGYVAARAGSAPDAVALQDTTPAPDAGEAPSAGEWTVVGGFVGYRVSEPPDITVAGQTEELAGDLVLDLVDDGLDVADDGLDGQDAGSSTAAGVRLVEARVEADLGGLRSDAAGRDSALRGRLLETARYPEAVFTLTEPVDLGPIEAGQVESVTARGELTVRERTAPVTAELSVRWDGPAVRVVGTMDVSLADYAVDVPTVAGVDTIRDAAVVEIDLEAQPAQAP